MKHSLFILVLFWALPGIAQNVFPPTGPVGVGTNDPKAQLHVVGNSRNYLVNKIIPGSSEDSQGINYLVLHKVYTGTLLMLDHAVSGKIIASRGGLTGWNRKWTVEVNTSSAYDYTRGNLIYYSEGTSLVTLLMNGERYLALEIANTSSLYYFSFTGYAENAVLSLATNEMVSDVQPFQSADPLGLNVGSDIFTGAIYMPLKKTGYAGSFEDVRGIWMQGADIASELAVGYSAIGGGASAIGFSRGGSWDTNIKFYTNAVDNVGTHKMTERMRINSDGSVGIGTVNTGTSKLAVEGTISARKVRVTSVNPWPDYVFAKHYRLPSIQEVEQYISAHQHLPDMPSAAEVTEEGLDLGEMNRKLLQKVEELTLYIIGQHKNSQQQQAQIDALKEAVDKLKSSKQ
ncbi:hypothetical protein MKQ68_10435 [Chitinophaga horti]|uniref:Chaperone of endosialidase n=1 Tax=Chitinophaga horti TaxID=2920382 RepID=A0ABY6J7E1_9BACT|nr:hypothetical protein [Chitinophaga horti]UYQ95517.1 hypothetical protein MKQ68_10435 [Chitinophaga horti]